MKIFSEEKRIECVKNCWEVEDKDGELTIGELPLFLITITFPTWAFQLPSVGGALAQY